jgi:hypothetical protein
MNKFKTPWTMRPQGEANQYMILDATGNWLMAIQVNGELSHAKQEDLHNQIVEAFK